MCPLLLNVTFNKVCHFIDVCLILGAKAGGKCVFWFGNPRLVVVGGGPGCGCASLPPFSWTALNGWRLNTAGKAKVCFISGTHCSVQDGGSRNAAFPGDWLAAECVICSLFKPGQPWMKVGQGRDCDGLSVTGEEEQAQAKEPQGFFCCLVFSNLYDSMILCCRLFCVRIFCTFFPLFSFFF